MHIVVTLILDKLLVLKVIIERIGNIGWFPASRATWRTAQGRFLGNLGRTRSGSG